MGTKEERLLAFIKAHSKHGHPVSVLEAFDKYAVEQEWTMHVGEIKGVVLDQTIRDLRPKFCVEIGTYCGYSAIRTARLLRPGARLLCVEYYQDYAEVAMEAIRYAGLDKKVKVIVGDSSHVIPQLKSKHGIQKIDFVFIDHVESMYTSDLKLMEKHQLLSSGSVVLADNVLSPGAPDFLKYVRGSPRYQCSFHPATVRANDGSTVQDGMEKAVYYQQR